jgi:hypothetical protein
MYMKEPGEAADNAPSAGPMLQVAIYGSAAITLVLGILPNHVLQAAIDAAR